MTIEGYGGAVTSNQFSIQVIAGLEMTDRPLKPQRKQCANRLCNRPFLSRQDGDIFHSEKCDPLWYHTPNGNAWPYVSNDNDPGNDNTMRIRELEHV